MHHLFGLAKPRTVAQALYGRYLLVITILLMLVGFVQLQSIHSALSLAGESSLSFALRDALPGSATMSELSPLSFKTIGSRLLSVLSIGGVNVRVYDRHLHTIGEQHSRMEPIDLLHITPQLAEATRTASSLPMNPSVHVHAMESQGQIVLLAAIQSRLGTIGYVELGYRQSLLNAIIWQQGLQYFAVSALVLVFAAFLLAPMVGVPLKPLYRLIETAQKIRAGAFQERMPVTGALEMVRLAEVMNEALDQLAMAVEKERVASQTMTQFVSAASHELRTPLTVIHGFTDVLLLRFDAYSKEMTILARGWPESPASVAGSQPVMWPALKRLGEMRHALLTMQSETTRLEVLVRDLLQLAKLDEGVKPHFQMANLAEILYSMQPQLQMLAQNRVLVYDLQPMLMACDVTMIQQIIYNLVMNAVQYTHPSDGRIHIMVGVAENSEGVRIVIQDNGTGIKGDVSRIFNRFYRAAEARERNPSGAGLGLAIVKMMVEAHGGTIHATSERGQGTTMWVEFMQLIKGDADDAGN